MRWYAVTMFVHVLGVIATFGGFAMQQRSGGRLRSATQTGEARFWSDVLRMTRSMVPSGAVMLLVTGAYLSYRMSGSHPPAWVIVAAVAVAGIGAAALTLVNPGFDAIARAVAGGGTSLPREAAARIGSAITWGAHSAANGAALGTLWLMTARPGLTESVLAVTLPALVGGVVGARLAAKARLAQTAAAVHSP